MSWQNIIERTAKSLNIKPSVVKKVMALYWDGVKKEIQHSGSVKISKWGIFKKTEIKPREGINRLRGEKKEYFKPTTIKLSFRIGKRYKEYLNSKTSGNKV